MGTNDVKYTVIIQNLPKHKSQLKEVRKSNIKFFIYIYFSLIEV